MHAIPSFRSLVRPALWTSLALGLVGAAPAMAAAHRITHAATAQGQGPVFGCEARWDEDYAAMVIGRVTPNSVAARCGLKSGDVVVRGVTADGSSVDVQEEGAEAFGRLVRGSRFTLFVFREGVAEDEPMRIRVSRARAGSAGPGRSNQSERRRNGGSGSLIQRTLANDLKPTKAVMLQRRSLRDRMFGNMDSHTLLAPKGWKVEGGPLWYPQQAISLQQVAAVTSPEGPGVLVGPSLSFTYSDSPFYRQAAQRGGPQAMRAFRRPPQRVGEGAILGYLPILRPQATNARLVEATRLPEAERVMESITGASSQMLRQQGTDVRLTVELAHVRYDEGGKSWDELVMMPVQRFAMPGLMGSPPVFNWNLLGTRSIRAPGGALDTEAPVLMTVLNSLRPTPRWDMCRAKLQMQLSQMRHQKRMADIRAAGQMANQISKTYSDISDSQMASWRRQQGMKDAGQAKVVNSIHEVHDYRTRDGMSMTFSQNYDRVFEDRSGNVLMTNNPLLDPATDPTLSHSDFRRLERIR